MASVKQINVKSRRRCFFNDVTNIKNFDSNLIKIDKKSHKKINTYYND